MHGEHIKVILGVDKSIAITSDGADSNRSGRLTAKELGKLARILEPSFVEALATGELDFDASAVQHIKHDTKDRSLWFNLLILYKWSNRETENTREVILFRST